LIYYELVQTYLFESYNRDYHQIQIAEPFTAFGGGIEPVEHGTEIVSCIGVLYPLSFTIVPGQVLVPLRLPVTFVEADVGNGLYSCTCGPEVFRMEPSPALGIALLWINPSFPV
jgi:hypothetical protein